MSEQVGEQVTPRWASCYSCRDYALERRDALAVPLADKAHAERFGRLAALMSPGLFKGEPDA